MLKKISPLRVEMTSGISDSTIKNEKLDWVVRRA
jgi:hypothetical protein